MLKDEENESTLIKWALDCYLQNEKDYNNKFESLFCLIKIQDHVGTLPSGFKLLYEAQYFSALPDTLDNTGGIFYQETIDGRHVIIFQSILYTEVKNRGENMRWAGQDASLVYNGCLNLLCDNCQINFSIDRQHKSITTSVKEGYVALLYKASIKDDENNFLIPDDKTLLDSLSKYCIAQHYLNASMRRESGAYDMYKQFINESNLLFSEYEKRNLLRKFDADAYIRGMHTATLPNKIHQAHKRQWQ
jgi:hypothetical protein